MSIVTVVSIPRPGAPLVARAARPLLHPSAVMSRRAISRSAVGLAAVAAMVIGHAHAETCVVQSVYDGDSLRIICPSAPAHNERVRLRGVYAAEMDEPGGIASRDRLRVLAPVGATVEIARHGHDRYGRTIGTLRTNEHGPITQTDIGPLAGRGARRCRPYSGIGFGRSAEDTDTRRNCGL